uniref:Sushi domain-containing protein n=1 Tax=Macrostomum lignano TaxID=282301 RepID=A0A1I8IHL5_9PLAT
SVCDVPALPGLRIDQPLTAGSSLVLACAQPLLSSRSGLTIVCARQASGNVTWQPDPASLGFQCLLPTAQVNTANIGLIIGIVVPCVILLLVGIVVVIIIVRRRSEKQPAGQPGAPPRQYSQDEGNRRNPHGVPPPHSAAAPLAYSPAGYGVVSGVDSDDNGGQFVPIMMPPQHQPRATMTPSPQPVPAQRRSFERSQQNQVMQGPDERATFPHQQQPPPPQQKPRSSKPKPTMSHSEVALELVWSGMHLEAILRDIRYVRRPDFGVLHPVADAGENIVGHVILGQRPADVIQPHAALNVQTELLVLADAGVHVGLPVLIADHLNSAVALTEAEASLRQESW